MKERLGVCPVCQTTQPVQLDPLYEVRLDLLYDKDPGICCPPAFDELTDPQDEAALYVLDDHMFLGQWCRGGGQNPEALVKEEAR